MANEYTSDTNIFMFISVSLSEHEAKIIIKDDHDNLIYISKENKGVFVKRGINQAKKLEVEK